MLSKYDAGAGQQDLKSELFLILSEKPDEFIVELHEKDHLYFYCTRIIQNFIFQKNNQFQRTYRKYFSELPDLEHEETKQDKILQEEMLERLEETINKLNEVEQTVIRLYLKTGSVKQVRKELIEKGGDISLPHVYNILSNAKKNILLQWK